MNIRLHKIGFACCLTLLSYPAFSTEIIGKIGVEGLKFFQATSEPEQHDSYGSLVVEPEFYQNIDTNSELKAKLFYRYDAQSDSRTHADIRELMYYRYTDDWELHAGIGKVFWGVTESRHLVDVINQIDNIEVLDDEQRLGQAMLQAKLIRNWGTVDLFLLPHFREVDFGNEDLRPNLGLKVTDALYQNSAEQRHIDLAARWNHSFDDLDIGVSYFNGTQRTPLINPVLENGELVLQPVYVQMQQFGIDAQYIYQDWLLKLEAVHRRSHQYDTTSGFDRYNSNAVVSGFEYTLYSVFDSTHDIGLIGEYLYDQWQQTTPFQRDWMTGIRWTWNDEQSTEWLFGHIYDLDDGTQIWQLEASRRLAETWKMSMTARWATEVDQNNNFVSLLDQQDQLSLKLDYYF